MNGRADEQTGIAGDTSGFYGGFGLGGLLSSLPSLDNMSQEEQARYREQQRLQGNLLGAFGPVKPDPQILILKELVEQVKRVADVLEGSGNWDADFFAALERRREEKS